MPRIRRSPREGLSYLTEVGPELSVSHLGSPPLLTAGVKYHVIGISTQLFALLSRGHPELNLVRRTSARSPDPEIGFELCGVRLPNWESNFTSRSIRG